MNKPEFEIGVDQSTAFKSVEDYLKSQNFNIVSTDLDRPWGGFFVLDERNAGKFANYFFPDDASVMLSTNKKLSPKILVVAPGKRLSWQYHNRRAEIWKLIAGQAGVVKSETDVEQNLKQIEMGEVVRLRVGERHRLVGMQGGWGAVAEIWQHTNPAQPSDENDIVRLQDDFSRT